MATITKSTCGPLEVFSTKCWLACSFSCLKRKAPTTLHWRTYTSSLRKESGSGQQTLRFRPWASNFLPQLFSLTLRNGRPGKPLPNTSTSPVAKAKRFYWKSTSKRSHPRASGFRAARSSWTQKILTSWRNSTKSKCKSKNKTWKTSQTSTWTIDCASQMTCTISMGLTGISKKKSNSLKRRMSATLVLARECLDSSAMKGTVYRRLRNTTRSKMGLSLARRMMILRKRPLSSKGSRRIRRLTHRSPIHSRLKVKDQHWILWDRKATAKNLVQRPCHPCLGLRSKASRTYSQSLKSKARESCWTPTSSLWTMWKRKTSTKPWRQAKTRGSAMSRAFTTKMLRTVFSTKAKVWLSKSSSKNRT